MPTQATTPSMQVAGAARVAAPRPQIDLPRWFLIFLGFVLAGYALGGRGFAYIGIPPLFVGEFALLLGVASFGCISGWWRVLALPEALMLYPFIGLGLLDTLPYLSTSG